MFTDGDGGVALVGVVGAATPAFLWLAALARHRQVLGELRMFTEISNIKQNKESRTEHKPPNGIVWIGRMKTG